MKNIKTEKIIIITAIMNKYNFERNETINRRLNNYDFQANTIITHNDKYIRISTETRIKGVYYVLSLFSDGKSKIDFEFN